MIKAAGLMLLTKAGETLLLCRAPGQSHEAEYCFPGGQIEGAETAEAAACRECKEEVGFLPEGERVLWTRRIAEDVDYTTFIQRIDEPFVPTLSAEHAGFLWAATESLLGDGVAAADADFVEAEHPRDPDGQFTEGSGGSGGANPKTEFTHSPGVTSTKAPGERAKSVSSALEKEGFRTSITHHSGIAGKSSYLTIFDPTTNRYISEVRFSDHLKGNPQNMVGVFQVLPGDDDNSVIELAHKMRARGPVADPSENARKEKEAAASKQAAIEEDAAKTRDAIARAYPEEWAEAQTASTETAKAKILKELRARYKESQSRSDSELTGPTSIGPFIPAGIRLDHYDLLPGREDEAGYFEPDGDFGKGDGSGQIAVANKVKVGDSYRTLAEPGRVLAHEAGHAIDHAMGHPSKGLSLPAPGARETAWEAVGARYYLADHDEFWAESCAVQTGPPKAMYFGGMTRARALELFGAEIGQVTEAVASWRISSV